MSIAVLFYCGVVKCQIYLPTNPTGYGEKVNRLKPLIALHVPEKDSLTLGTTDTTAQIFYNRRDSSIWFYSKSKGFSRLGATSGGGVSYTDITYSASSNQTDFITPTTITDIKRIQVFRNGVENQITQVNSNSIRIPMAAAFGDRIKIVQTN